eukprot:4154295-Pleurochrysis_carterae.AAC.1
MHAFAPNSTFSLAAALALRLRPLTLHGFAQPQIERAVQFYRPGSARAVRFHIASLRAQFTFTVLVLDAQFNFARTVVCHTCKAHVDHNTKYLSNRLKELKQVSSQERVSACEWSQMLGSLRQVLVNDRVDQ